MTVAVEGNVTTDLYATHTRLTNWIIPHLERSFPRIQKFLDNSPPFSLPTFDAKDFDKSSWFQLVLSTDNGEPGEIGARAKEGGLHNQFGFALIRCCAPLGAGPGQAERMASGAMSIFLKMDSGIQGLWFSTPYTRTIPQDSFYQINLTAPFKTKSYAV